MITKTKISQPKALIEPQFISKQKPVQNIELVDRSQNMIDQSVIQVGSARGDSSRGPKQTFAIAKYATTTDVQKNHNKL